MNPDLDKGLFTIRKVSNIKSQMKRVATIAKDMEHKTRKKEFKGMMEGPFLQRRHRGRNN